MFGKMFRLVLVLGLLGAIGWYVWNGLTAVAPEGEELYFDPWGGDTLAVPGIALTVCLCLYPLAGIRSAMRGSNSAAMRSAPIGIGTITAVERTGLTINDSPQLRLTMTVRTADGQVFESTAKQLVDMTELGLVVPGVALPVRYLPGRTGEVEIDKSGDHAQAQAVHDQVMIHQGLSTPRTLDIARRGVHAQAVVGAVRPTGQIVGGNPKMQVTLLVNRQDGSTYETTVEKVISVNLVGYLQVGRILTVHYLPGAEQEVVLQMPANPNV